jgi:hypothetical protein
MLESQHEWEIGRREAEPAAILKSFTLVEDDWIKGELENGSSSFLTFGGSVNVRNGIASSSSMSRVNVSHDGLIRSIIFRSDNTNFPNLKIDNIFTGRKKVDNNVKLQHKAMKTSGLIMFIIDIWNPPPLPHSELKLSQKSIISKVVLTRQILKSD